MFRVFRTKWASLILLLTITLGAFQNCSPYAGFNSRTGSSLSKAGNGNGNSYDGKLVITAPEYMSPGETVTIQVEGGAPPYNLTTDVSKGTFVQISEQTFEYTLPVDSINPAVEISAQDSEGFTGSTSIRIWGVNNWFFETPVGIDSDSQGNIYLTEQGIPSITVLDPLGVEIMRIDNSNTANLDIRQPEDIELTANNNLIVTDSDSNGVYHFYVLDPQGPTLLAKVEDTNGDRWSGCGGINHLDIDANDRIFIACDNSVFVYNSNGVYLETFTLNPQTSFAIESLMIMSNNRLLVARRSSQFEIYDIPSNALLNSYRLSGKYDSYLDSLVPVDLLQLGENRAVLMNNSGDGGSLGWSFEIDSGRLTDIFRGNPENPIYLGPSYGLSLLPDGRIAATSPLDGNIKFHEGDSLINSSHWGPAAADLRSFYNPTSIHISANNLITITDNWNYRLTQFDQTGQVLASDYGEEGRDRYLKGSNDVTVDSAGNIFVANTTGSNIEVIQANGEYRSFGIGVLNGPEGVDLSASGILFVADTWNNSIKTFTTSGDLQIEFSAPADSQLSRPKDIIVNGDRVLVLNSGAGNILEYDLSGNYVGVFSAPTNEFDIREASKFALDSARDRIYVTDTDRNRVVVLNAAGEALSAFGGEGTEFGEFNSPRGVAVDSDGYVYVVDRDNSRIQIFPPQ